MFESFRVQGVPFYQEVIFWENGEAFGEIVEGPDKMFYGIVFQTMEVTRGDTVADVKAEIFP